jgi:lysine-N-methylase
MPIRPDYAESFRCIGSACEDTCCQGWNVPVDEATYHRYQALPASPLRTLIVESIQRSPEPEAAAKPFLFAKIRMNSSNECPMLGEDHLCRIQQEHGESLLSHACATYPRVVHSFAGHSETALTLSCPEAARHVLLNPALLRPASLSPPVAEASNDSPGFMRGLKPPPPTASGISSACQAESSLPSSFWLIRNSMLALVTNRTYPLWQRMFLLGILCRRLDELAKEGLASSIPEFLSGFEASLATPALRAGMDALPIDLTAQLDVVLRLAGLMLHRSNVRPRFVECVTAFTRGIGNGPGATMETLTARFALAHDCYYAPFFARHPHILENLLINTIIRCQFPYGRDGMKTGPVPSMTKEFALLTGQFALLKGLLIGVAGFHREGFDEDHVIHTVQAASKHFEHHPEFLNDTYALLVESKMDSPRGLAILLRNEGPVVRILPTPGAPERASEMGEAANLKSPGLALPSAL